MMNKIKYYYYYDSNGDVGNCINDFCCKIILEKIYYSINHSVYQKTLENIFYIPFTKRAITKFIEELNEKKIWTNL